MTCKFCGATTYRRKIYCDSKCRDHWNNSMRTLAKQEGLPVRCRQCGIIFIRYTKRFKVLCPTCTRQKWYSVSVYIPLEWQRLLRKVVGGGKVTIQQISTYLQAHLYKYLERFKP